MTQAGKPLTLIAGAGPGNGMAFARAFAPDGALALLNRSTDDIQAEADALPDAATYACDVTDAAQIAAALDAVRAKSGEVTTLIYNAGSAAFGGFEDMTADKFEESWRINALGGFLFAKQVVPAMKAAGQGTIVFVGATASLRGGPNSAAFGPAKAAQRSLAESMARSLWPLGIHVALVVLDGRVDSPRAREASPDLPDHAFIDPNAVAAAVRTLTDQPRNAWTFELILRPSVEEW